MLRLEIFFDGRLGSTELVEALSIPASLQQFSGIAAKVREAKPDAIYIASWGAQQVQIVKQLRDNGVTAQIASFSSFVLPELESLPESKGALYTTQYVNWESQDPITKRFVESFKAKYPGKQPTIYAANFYNAVRLFALLSVELQKKGKPLTGENLLAQRLETKAFDMVGGRIVFLDNGTVAAPMQVAAYMGLTYGASLLLVLPVAMAVAGLLSLVLALPALRVRGEYFVAASLGLQMLGVTVFAEWKSVTGGNGGLIAIPPARLFQKELDGPFETLVLALVCLAVIIAVTSVLLRSSFGRNLKAIRDSESAAHACGKNVAAIKTLSVVVSSALAAVAGVLYAFYLSFINVESFTLDTSVQLMAMVIIGGIGTLLGPIVGAVLLMLLPSLFSYMPFLPQTEIGSIQQIVYGLAMVLLMIFRPGGIAGVSKGTS